MVEIVAALVCVSLLGIVILFQLCLAAGAPWGAASMGGKYPGKYPQKIRVVAIINSIVLLFIALIILAKAGIISPLQTISRVGIWFIVVFFAISTVVNSISPSKVERIWAPIALVQCVTSLVVALN